MLWQLKQKYNTRLTLKQEKYMWIMILIAIFVGGGIIYKMGQTNNDSSKMTQGAAEGGWLFINGSSTILCNTSDYYCIYYRND